MRSILLFATYAEAAATIRALGAVANPEKACRYRFHDEGEILICGMGIEAASEAARVAPSEGCHWVNIGIAGCLDRAVPVGTALQVGSVALLHADSESGGYSFIEEEMIHIQPSCSAVLFTSTQPLYTAPQLVGRPPLVDMEGYALVHRARERGVPFTMIKVVSDFCTASSHGDILRTIDALSHRLAEESLRILSP